MLREGNQTGIVGNPKNLGERTILATQCVSQYKFTMPMVIDGMDGKVNSDYQAAPVRVTVVDVDGKVAFYAGRGPFDFRLPPVERTLKKLIAGKGRMPPPRPLQWGEPVNGLRCGLSVDPQKLAIGDDVVLRLSFQNTSQRPIALAYNPATSTDRISIRNDDGRTLKVEPAAANRWARMRRAAVRRGSGSSPQRIDPGQIFESEVEGRIVDVSSEALPVGGQFRAVFALDPNEPAPSPASDLSVWTGEIRSGACTIHVTQPEQLSCVNCHGDSDYHHVQVRQCDTCHVGKVGEPNFGTRNESCAKCHPREGMRGRRQILGPGGEFDMMSSHIPGTIDDKDCLLCHDQSRHADGVVDLIDPDSGGTRTWTGTRTGFCLACHDGNPPTGVVFPDESKGSGFDKTKFMGSAFVLNERGCSLCHNPHGSSHPSLLKDLHTP